MPSVQPAVTITAPAVNAEPRQFEEVQLGKEDEFVLIPDIDSSIPPSDLDAWSLAPSSAAAQNTENLRTQTKLPKLSSKKQEKFKRGARSSSAGFNDR